jgi:hypothetical protein
LVVVKDLVGTSQIEVRQGCEARQWPQVGKITFPYNETELGEGCHACQCRRQIVAISAFATIYLPNMLMPAQMNIFM